jgi:hypothetical protein
MSLGSLIFRENFVIQADYNRVVSFFKLRLDKKYFKGYIDKDEIKLFFTSSLFSTPMSFNLPITQLTIENKPDKHGRIEIKFRIINFFTILYGLGAAALLIYTIFNLKSGDADLTPMVASLMVLGFFYLFLTLQFRTELAEFKKDIEQLQLL